MSPGDAPVLLVRDLKARAARVVFALQMAGAMVQEAHWDTSCSLVLALGTRAQNRRFVAAIRRGLE